MKTLRRPLLRFSLVFGTSAALSCANANQLEVDDDAGVATGGVMSTGGKASSGGKGSGSSGGAFSGGATGSPSGGTISGHTGGSNPVGNTGGAPDTGGSMMGGATSNTGGGESDNSGGKQGSGGQGDSGDCADERKLTDPGVGYGEYAVYTCELVQGACTADLLGEPALFQCTDTHVNNCRSQEPTGSSSWTFIGLCSALGMGGAGGAQP